MSRPEHPPVSDHVASKIAGFHAETVAEVRAAIEQHDVVVVGMGWNPHVKRARGALDAAGIAYHYLGYGNYLTGWRQRLAIKLWSGWPTFPQVYVKNTLIGGANEVQHELSDETLMRRLKET